MRVRGGGEFFEAGAQTLPKRLQVELLAETGQDARQELVELGRRRRGRRIDSANRRRTDAGRTVNLSERTNSWNRSVEGRRIYLVL